MMPELSVPAIEAMIKSGLVPHQATDAETGGNLEASTETPMQTPQKLHKTRSLSDSAPQLSPSPKFREPLRASKDDHSVLSSPHTPRRPEFFAKGLQLKMPDFKEMGMPSPAHLAQRVPLSPQLDAHNTYASPATLLPRRSRGAEFSRACTNLHHSTLADHSSPDSSPTITQKGMMIPSKKSRANSMIMDSPNVNYPAWGIGNGERTAPSSSLGSISMMDADSSSSSDDADTMDPDDNEDPMLMTPQATRPNPFSASTPGNNPNAWANMFSPGGAPTFMSIQRRRLGKGRSRKSSSSASGHSSLASPVPGSPPNGKAEGYFAREAVMRKTGSRRESLSLFTNDLHISSGNDSGDEAAMIPQTPGVVRRPVTRRGNLLPKSRQFGRIKAELFEEAAPIDSEARREAEIIRQVREADVEVERPSVTAQSSPALLPTVPGLEGLLEGVPEEESESNMSVDSSSTKGLFGTFNLGQARNAAGGRNYFNMDHPAQTPPPQYPRAGSIAVSDDISMDSPSVSSTSTSLASLSATVRPDFNAPVGWASRSSTPQPFAPPSAADGLKKSNKRRRDDDLDGNSLKRRAVSPGVSLQNSPVLSQSPAQRDSGLWGAATKASREHAALFGPGDRPSNGTEPAKTPSMGPKRIGLQGMTDTSDGLMKMSIE